VQILKDRSYLIKVKIWDCAWGMGAFTLGLGLNLYKIGDVVASVMISSIVIFTLTLTLTSMLLIWHAAKSVAVWARIASRNSTLLPCLKTEFARSRTIE
jgi:hypothetical protein